MRVLIAGSGAREHALAWACTRQNSNVELFCAPGNGGTATMPAATNVAVAADDPAAIVRVARDAGAQLVVIGPDAALAAGVADACMATGIPVFGPTASAARIESSKVFAKTVMDAAGIPTARWQSGRAADRRRLLALVDELDGRCVVKADGLALGKGVVVCHYVAQARAAIEACFDGRFGAAGSEVLIEELLLGEELSVLALTDSRNIRVLPAARDYKRAGDGDSGPNTGGMGALTPPAGVDRHLLERVEREVLRPCVDELAEMGAPFSGCLYAGLMLTGDGLRVLEFNARFGDPETQVVLPVLSDDVLTLLADCAAGSLTPGVAQAAEPSRAVGVVLAAAGYPDAPRKGDVIAGLDKLDPGILAFHAGTRREADDSLRTDGGRVLTLVARGASIHEARQRAYDAVPAIHFEGKQFRGDIGINQVGDR
jgi:phosphoribosylamine--glycine ligase